MLKIEVTAQAPQPAPRQLWAWIDLEAGSPLASARWLRARPGWADLERRRAAGPLTSPYLSASDPPLVWLPGAAAKHDPPGEKVKVLAAEALALARDRRSDTLIFGLDALGGAKAAPEVAEGLALHAYRFEKYREAKESAPDPKIIFVAGPASRLAARAAVERRLLVCEAVGRARDLVNEPGSVATPAEIEARARAVAKARGLSIDVLDAARLRKEGYEGLLAVGRGGKVPPRMIVLEHRPANARSGVHLGLLGKGITFDTGGVSIKPAANMWQMKGDMAGAAAVLYTMDLIGTMHPRLRVSGIIVTAQNYVDRESIVPGDVIRARNGKTIHVDNTDAEGRLILTDGLWRAGEQKVTHLVDVATLTGSIVRALGSAVTGAFGNDGFVDRVIRLADQCGEPCWKMPLIDEYIELMKTPIADLNNIGSTPNGGAIQAALFLREFLPKGVSWAHLDIAGTFLQEKKWRYFRPGATGIMVRTLFSLAEAMAARRG